MEALIDEWYPGLRDFDVATGEKLVTSGTLCPHCLIDREPYCFRLKELEHLSYESDEVMCPVHKGKVLMEQLVISYQLPNYQCKNFTVLYRPQTLLLMI